MRPKSSTKILAFFSAITFWIVFSFMLEFYGTHRGLLFYQKISTGNLNTTSSNFPYSLIVVPGMYVLPDKTPSPPLRWRTEVAVGFYKMKLAPLILFSGGQGGNPISECFSASNHAIFNLSVPSESCILECDSRNTAQNAAFSFQTFKKFRNNTFNKEENILIVTDAYHVWRTQLHFENYFKSEDEEKYHFNIETVSSYSDWFKVYYQVREVGAVVKNLILFRLPSYAWSRLIDLFLFPFLF